jgi:hypothetical protein
MAFEHVGWLVINILLPFFLPILGLLSFKILPLPVAIEVRFIALIKDGQWCWTAIALSASTVFEYLNAQRISTSTFSRDNLFIFLLSLTTFLSVGLAAGGAVFNTPYLAKPYSPKQWLIHYKTLVTSIGISFLTAIFSSALHFST